MSGVMRQIPFGQLMDWALREYEETGAIFGIHKFFRKTEEKSFSVFGGKLELPLGPAAGPHTQLAQNLVAGYLAGGRFFELKTVQTLDGEDLPVSKPCISASDEGYNVEWSTELRVPQALEEYVKGWFALKLLSRELGLGSPDGFIFNMSVGYDLAGIRTKKIDDFIEGLKNAEGTAQFEECRRWSLQNISRFRNVDEAYVNGISPEICRSITLSTLHGCPPEEIERIAVYLLTEKRLHTFIKCNPTLLGYERARRILDGLGYDYLVFDDHHFKADLQFADAVPMLRRLIGLAGTLSLTLGVKLTNTFPVAVTAGELPGEEMYLSGRPLFPISTAVADRLSREFGGNLRVSYSGGADAHNIGRLLDAGIWPVTVATTLLKPGGYQRLRQMAEQLEGCLYGSEGVRLEKLRALADDAQTNPLYRKQGKPIPQRKMNARVPLLDCFTAPCRDGCPIGQDIPAYLRLVGEGNHLEALRVIIERNPLPFITGTICSHSCMDKCTRGFYESSVGIRAAKLEAAEKAFPRLMRELRAPAKSGGRVAVIGGGPAGLSAAWFLARAGRPVTIFEKRNSLGGIVRHVIPAFRIPDEAIDNDIALIRKMGAEIRLNCEVSRLEELIAEGFERIIVAVGAWKPGNLELRGGRAIPALAFMEQFKRDPGTVKLGKNVAIIGGGSAAIDAARAAKRVGGVERVLLVYRRTKRYMPADQEELALALADGVELYELLAPVELRDGQLICARMKLGAPDESGRRSPAATGERVPVPAETVISAVGNLADTEFLGRCGIHTDSAGKAIVDKDTLETNLPGVYVIGDAMGGPATIAEAVADAIRCAGAIAGVRVDRYASRNINQDTKAVEEKCGRLHCRPESVPESERCLECATICECCVQVCPNRANIALRVDGRAQIVHLDYLCNECGNCETFCPYSSAPYRDKFTLFGSEKDFENSENQGFLPLEGGRIRVRWGEKAADDPDEAVLPEDVRKLIQAVVNNKRLILKRRGMSDCFGGYLDE